MAKFYPVKLKVISQEGTCVAGHKVGDEFESVGLAPKGLCMVALNAMMPSIWSLMYGGSFPWSEDPEAERVACPDADNPVVFEVPRVRPES